MSSCATVEKLLYILGEDPQNRYCLTPSPRRASVLEQVAIVDVIMPCVFIFNCLIKGILYVKVTATG